MLAPSLNVIRHAFRYAKIVYLAKCRLVRVPEDGRRHFLHNHRAPKLQRRLSFVAIAHHQGLHHSYPIFHGSATSFSCFCSSKTANMALDKFFHNKIESMKLEIIQGQAVLRRLEAQRNDYNSRVRLLREELGLLQQPGSYVGEVVKVMGTKKVLVKVHPEGKYGTLISHYEVSLHESDILRFSGGYIRLCRHQQTHSGQARDSTLRFLQARENASFVRRSTCVAHDGRESARQHV